MHDAHASVRVLLDCSEPLGREASPSREQSLGEQRLVEGPDRRRTNEQRDRVGRCVLEEPTLVDSQVAVRERQPGEKCRPLPRADGGACEAHIAATVADERGDVLAIATPALPDAPPPARIEGCEPHSDQPPSRRSARIEVGRAATGERGRNGATEPPRGEHESKIVEVLLTARRTDGSGRLEPRGNGVARGRAVGRGALELDA